MITNKISRRIFLKIALASLLTACNSQQNEGTSSTFPAIFQTKPTTTPVPPPTATPPPSADGVVEAYLDAWQQSNFESMYHLLTPVSQQGISLNQFRTAYQHVWDQTTALNLEVQLQSLLTEGTQGDATFRSIWETSLFDILAVDHTMHLQFEAGVWQIVWQPTLILPQLGQGITLALLEEKRPRGKIYDATNQLLASHQQLITVGVVPGLIEDEPEVINQLSEISDIPPAVIEEKISHAQPSWFIPLTEITFEANIEYHERLAQLAGVERRPHPVRAYHYQEIACHMIGTIGRIPADELESYQRSGYNGDELIGVSGIEGWGELFLAGKRGGRLVTFSPTRKELAEIATADPRPGGDIYLSLDIDLQRRAEEILGQQRGAIVVMEPTGFIKAMASYPRFNPQWFANGIEAGNWADLLANPDRPLINRGVQGIYPPASVFKVVSIAAALEKLALSPTTTFTCTGVWDGLGEDFPKRCWVPEGHGVITLKDGLTQSCDVVFYEIALALYKQDPNFLSQFARLFGFGQETGVLGLEELAGVVPDETWKQRTLNEPFFSGDAVNMAIGQGNLLTTPLQITQMMAALSTGGQLFRPQIVRHIHSAITGDQLFYPEAGPTLPLSAENLTLIQEALVAVAHSKSGTARYIFEDVDYTLVGKTGTAETGIDAPHAWFAGYAPADEPQIVITVILENAGEGSAKAAPLFKVMLESYFDWAAKQRDGSG